MSKLSTDTIGSACTATSDNPNFLSPNQAATQMPITRRSLRRRSTRKRRSISCGPGQRRTMSLKDKLLAASSSQPNSPTNLNNPLIQIDPPRPNPVPRPDKLGVTECYTSSPLTLQVPDIKSMSYSNFNGPTTRSEQFPSDSSNPCSTVDLHDSCPDSADTNYSASQTEFKHDWPDSGHDSNGFNVKPSSLDRKIKQRSNHNWSESKQDSVEARIALADIKAIVRPKQLQASKNKVKSKEFVSDNSYLLPNVDSEHVINSTSGSYDHFSSAMQTCSKYDTSCAQCSRLLIPETGDIIVESGEEMFKNVHSGLYSDVDSGEDHIDSTTALLGATRQFPDKKMATERNFCDLNSMSTLKENICIGPSLDFKVPVPLNGPKSVACETKESNADKILANSCSRRLSLEADSPADSVNSKHSSCSLYKNIIPSTPNRQMFKMPLARIESFHSDDFDSLAADLDFTNGKSVSTSQTPSGSVNTPTLPCFAYKLHLLSKMKSGKLKHNKDKEYTSNSIECNTYANEENRRTLSENEPR